MKVCTIKNVTKSWDVDTMPNQIMRKAVIDHLKGKKRKKQNDISHVITRKPRDRKKKNKAVFHDFVDAARFAGGARSLERRAVTGA